MKFLRYILFLLFVVMLTPNTMVAQNVGERQVPCDSSVVGRSLRQAEELCTIRNVKKTKGFNVIFAKIKSNDFLIVILSKRHSKRKKTVNKIECGNDYNFVLRPLYNFPEKYFPMIVDATKYKIMGKKLKIKGSHYVYEIYTTPNLIGLYYCPTHNE